MISKVKTIVLLVLIISSFAPSPGWCLFATTFDFNNFKQNLQNWRENLRQLNEQRKQVSQSIERVRQGHQQLKHVQAQVKGQKEALKMHKINLKKLDFSTLGQLKDSFLSLQRSCEELKRITAGPEKQEQEFRDLFTGKNVVIFPGSKQDKLLQQRLDANIELNKKALQSIRVAETYAKDQQTTNDLLQKSQQADGTLQALQSANQLTGMVVKNGNDLKLMLAANHEQKAKAISEKNTNKVIARKLKKNFIRKSKKPTNKITMPELK